MAEQLPTEGPSMAAMLREQASGLMHNAARLRHTHHEESRAMQLEASAQLMHEAALALERSSAGAGALQSHCKCCKARMQVSDNGRLVCSANCAPSASGPFSSAPEPSEKQWRCFHCGEVFTDADAATEHFGPNQGSIPGCKIDLAEYRRMEELHARNLAEDTDKDRAYYRLQSEMQISVRRAEEAGYAKGLKDAGYSGEPGAIQILRSLLSYTKACEGLLNAAPADQVIAAEGFLSNHCDGALSPFSKRTHIISEASRGVFRLTVGFENAADVDAAHEYVGTIPKSPLTKEVVQGEKGDKHGA